MFNIVYVLCYKAVITILSTIISIVKLESNGFKNLYLSFVSLKSLSLSLSLSFFKRMLLITVLLYHIFCNKSRMKNKNID